MEITVESLSEEDVEKVLAFLPYFSQDVKFGEWVKVENDEPNTFIMPHVEYTQGVREFSRLLYDVNFLIDFDWGSWDEGREIISNPEKISKTDIVTLRMLMTTIMRNDRFNEGALLSAIESGTISHILTRLEAVKDTYAVSTHSYTEKHKKKEKPIKEVRPATYKYTIERTVDSGPYVIECQYLSDAESLFEQVKDHQTTIYTRLLVDGKEVKSHKSKQNMLAMSDFLADD